MSDAEDSVVVTLRRGLCQEVDEYRLIIMISSDYTKSLITFFHHAYIGRKPQSKYLLCVENKKSNRLVKHLVLSAHLIGQELIDKGYDAIG